MGRVKSPVTRAKALGGMHRSTRNGDAERERAKQLATMLKRREPRPQKHDTPRWVNGEPEMVSAASKQQSPPKPLVSGVVDRDEAGEQAEPNPFHHTIYRAAPGVKTIGELISDPLKILNLPSRKIITDEYTDAIIREQMIAVIPDGQLTTRRLNRLVSEGVNVCIFLWHDRKQSNAHFWERIGTSGGWLRHLGGRVTREFFLTLCAQYHNGSRKEPNNEMMRAIATLHGKLADENKGENKGELDAYMRSEVRLPATARMFLGRHQSRSNGSGVRFHGGDIFEGAASTDGQIPQVLGPLVPIDSFGAEERRKQEEERQRRLAELNVDLKRKEGRKPNTRAAARARTRARASSDAQVRPGGPRAVLPETASRQSSETVPGPMYSFQRSGLVMRPKK